MSGLSTFINAGAGAINGYRDQQYQQNAQDYAQQVRANDELKMQAAQQTYQPQAQAQVAQAGLSTAQANGNASLVPQQTQLASSQLDGKIAAQPYINETGTNTAQIQAGTTGTQAKLLPQTQTNMKLAQLSADHQASFGAVSGLYTAMMQGAPTAQAYMQKMADSGAYPSISGKKIGTVGLTPDGQNFAAQDDQGNTLFTLPTQAIQQAYQMSKPTDWKVAGNTLFGVQGGRVTSQTSAPEFKPLRPGETGVTVQGGQIVNSTTAPVPKEFSDQHQSAFVKNVRFLADNVTKGDYNSAVKIAQQANSMSKAQFLAMTLPNMMTLGNMKAGDAVSNLSQAYDMIRGQDGGTPGLSNMPNSNTNPTSTIDSLIGGPNATNPANTVANPYATDN
jgi:hypothetical protein